MVSYLCIPRHWDDACFHRDYSPFLYFNAVSLTTNIDKAAVRSEFPKILLSSAEIKHVRFDLSIFRLLETV